MRRRLKKQLANTKSTMRAVMGKSKKTSKARRSHKKLLSDRKGRLAKQRKQQQIDNENRHLLKKILRLHFRKGNNTEKSSKFHRHLDLKTSYMRQRHENLSRISKENQRMIKRLLRAKPEVTANLGASTQYVKSICVYIMFKKPFEITISIFLHVCRAKLGGSLMRPGHVGVMRQLNKRRSTIGKSRHHRSKSAPV